MRYRCKKGTFNTFLTKIQILIFEVYAKFESR